MPYDEKFAIEILKNFADDKDSNADIKRCLGILDVNARIASEDMLSTWHLMATNALKTICQIILIARVPIANNEVIRLGLTEINQAIFVNMNSIHRLYTQEGLNKLTSEQKIHPGKVSMFAIEGYQHIDILKEHADRIKLELNQSYINQGVLDRLFSDKKMQRHAYLALKKLASHEQWYADPFYKRCFGDSKLTLSEALNKTNHSVLSYVGSLFGLNKIKIGSKNINFSNFNLGNLEDRLLVSRRLAKATADILMDSRLRRDLMQQSVGINTLIMRTYHSASDRNWSTTVYETGIEESKFKLDITKIREIIGLYFHPEHVNRTTEFDNMITKFVRDNFVTKTNISRGLSENDLIDKVRSVQTTLNTIDQTHNLIAPLQNLLSSNDLTYRETELLQQPSALSFIHTMANYDETGQLFSFVNKTMVSRDNASLTFFKKQSTLSIPKIKLTDWKNIVDKEMNTKALLKLSTNKELVENETSQRLNILNDENKQLSSVGLKLEENKELISDLEKSLNNKIIRNYTLPPRCFSREPKFGIVAQPGRSEGGNNIEDIALSFLSLFTFTVTIPCTII